MGGFSVWHWVIVVIVILILFGRGRLSSLMGDLGRGMGLFKREMRDVAANGAAFKKSVQIDTKAESRET